MFKIRHFIRSKNLLYKKNIDHHTREVLNFASVAFVLKVAATTITFFFNVFIARVLGPNETGIYYFAFTVMTISTVFGRLGLENSLLRFTAANSSVMAWEKVKGAYQKGISISLFASIIITLIIFLFTPWLTSSMISKPELKYPIRYMILAIAPFTIISLHSELLKGIKRIGESFLVNGICVPALSLTAFLAVGQNWGLRGAIFSYLFAISTTSIIAVLLWRKATPQLRNVKGQFKTMELVESSLPLFWVTSMSLLMNWTTTILLGYWGTNADVGVFNIASRTAMLISFILIAVNSIAAPKFAALYKVRDMQNFEALARLSTKIMFFLASPILIIVVLFPSHIMQLFGSQFVAGAAILRILAIGQFINVITGPVGYILMMSGNEKLMRNNIMITTATCIVLNYLLIPKFGILGGAIATAICLSFMNIISAIFVWCRLGLTTLPIFRKTYV